MHRNTIWLVVLILCLIVIVFATKCSQENFDYRTINQGASGFKKVPEEPHYTCVKKDAAILNNQHNDIVSKNDWVNSDIIAIAGPSHRSRVNPFININKSSVDENTKEMIIDLRDLDEYEHQYKNYVDWIRNQENYESFLTRIIAEEKQQLENSHAIKECAHGCNISPTELIEKLAQLQHLHAIENNIRWQEFSLEWMERSIPMFKKRYEEIENNLGEMTIKHIDFLERNRFAQKENKDIELNQIKEYIERLDGAKRWLQYFIKSSELRLKSLKEQVEKEKLSIMKQKDALKPYEECTKYCNTCPAFNKLSNLIWEENSKKMIPQVIKRYENDLVRVDKEISYEKRMVSKNPQIRNYLDCREKCDGGKTPLNRPDNCGCIKELTNTTLHNFVDCTMNCNDFDPTICYNRCVDNTLHEQIFNDKPIFWWMNRDFFNERQSNNMCYKKNGDKLPTGNYVETCGNCAFSDNNLSCHCRTRDQNCIPTTLKIDNKCKYIQNCNGNLKCGDC